MLRFAVLVLAVFAVGATPAAAEDGSDLWLRYEKAGDKQYRRAVTTVVVDNVHANDVHRHTPGLRMEPGSSERLVESSLEAARDELVRGLSGLLGRRVPVATGTPRGAVVVGTRESSATVRRHVSRRDLASVGDEGYVIRSVSDFTVIAGNTELGALYGSFAFLRRMQTERRITRLDLADEPRVENRHLNNWETTRLYAGNDATGTGGLNGENGSIFNFAATGPSAGAQPAGDPRPLHRRRARARLTRHQRLRDQPRQRRQRLPDAGPHRPGGGAGRRAPSLRHQDLARHQLHGAHRPAVRARHAHQRAARSVQRRVPRLVEPEGPRAAGARSRTSWASP